MSHISLKNVDSIYKGENQPTLKDINLEIKRGEFVYIIGPNAAGKTTLLETINGMLKICDGIITVDNINVKKKGQKVRKKISYMIQTWDIDTNEPFLVKDIVMMGRTGVLGTFVSPKKEDWDLVMKCLYVVGMKKFKKRPIGKLSGGQQQKVFLARALAQDAEIIMLDEPFSNLDTDSRKIALEILKNYKEDNNATILIVSHFLSDVSFQIDFIDRIIIMKDGQVIKNGSATEVINSEEYNALEIIG